MASFENGTSFLCRHNIKRAGNESQKISTISTGLRARSGNQLPIGSYFQVYIFHFMVHSSQAPGAWGRFATCQAAVCSRWPTESFQAKKAWKYFRHHDSTSVLGRQVLDHLFVLTEFQDVRTAP